MITNHCADQRVISPCVTSSTPVAFGWDASPVTGLIHATDYDHRPEEARTASWRITATTRWDDVAPHARGSRCHRVESFEYRHPSGVDRAVKTGRRTVRK